MRQCYGEEIEVDGRCLDQGNLPAALSQLASQAVDKSVCKLLPDRRSVGVFALDYTHQALGLLEDL